MEQRVPDQTTIPIDPTVTPILNTPYEAPKLHWSLDPTFRAVGPAKSGRRESGQYLPVPSARQQGAQIQLGLQNATAHEPHPRINAIRTEVEKWTQADYPGTSAQTRRLLEYWTSDEIEVKPFFAQLDAARTLIWLHEHTDARRFRGELDAINAEINDGVPRTGTKMATGTGKTRTMAMWLLYLALSRSERTDVLILAPNLTVRDRLGELDPSNAEHAGKIYRALCPPGIKPPLGRLHVTVLNFQAFQQRDTLTIAGPKDVASGIAKNLIKGGPNQPDPENWTESPTEMLNRLLPAHRGSGEIFVVNDESHHCQRALPENGTEARALWFGVLKALRDEGRLAQVFDFSATPIFMSETSRGNAQLVPWTVSDYPLIEAVEAGLTKIPRVPVQDELPTDEQPVFREVFRHIQRRHGTGGTTLRKGAALPTELDDLLRRMHEHYEERRAQYERHGIIPVMIIVADTIANAIELHRRIGGWQDETTKLWQSGGFPIFSNCENGIPKENPPTLLVHSKEGEAYADDKVLKAESQLFAPDNPKATKEARQAHIREVFNTVGRQGEPGEHIRCIVSVSMLTEGWDATTVTHILGYRAFDSQLLCEQIAGRALRRTDYALPPSGRYDPEYASIFGVPFSFMRGEESERPERLPPAPLYTVENQNDHRHLEISFPNLVGYRSRPPARIWKLDPTKVTEHQVRQGIAPGRVVSEGAIGEEDILTSHKAAARAQEGVFALAREATERLANETGSVANGKRSTFGSVLIATRDWLNHPKVDCPDPRAFLDELVREEAAVALLAACVSSEGRSQRVEPIFADELDPAADRTLSSSHDPYQSRLPNHYPLDTNERSEKAQSNVAPCHSHAEVRMAVVLETNEDVEAWARNFRLGWKVPYAAGAHGRWRLYEPDFVARLKTGGHLVIEVKGEMDVAAEQKRKAMEQYWCPALSESTDPACEGHWHYRLVDADEDMATAVASAVTEAYKGGHD